MCPVGDGGLPIVTCKVIPQALSSRKRLLKQSTIHFCNSFPDKQGQASNHDPEHDSPVGVGRDHQRLSEDAGVAI
jgi:hypothetical protein